MIEEFKKFIARGNVLDLAIGVVIGAAFTSIVNSLVDDIINPLIGLITGGRADFSNFYLQIGGDPLPPGTPLAAAREAGVVLAYGNFITQIINFLIVAFILFLIVRAANRFFAREAAKPEEPPAPTPDQQLLAEIRDLLKVQAGRGN